MKAFFAALEDAGMPFYADEYQDFGVQPKDSHQIGNDFDPTPLAISGGNRIDAKSLHALLLRTPGAVVLDVGRGAGVIRSGHWIWSQGFEVDPDTAMETYIKHDKATVESPIIVMSDSPLGWDSYNAALDLIARGYRNVLWFRGGEEAWAAQGYNSVDLRPM
jgi:rhodanese-related sulfurtransferase